MDPAVGALKYFKCSNFKWKLTFGSNKAKKSRWRFTIWWTTDPNLLEYSNKTHPTPYLSNTMHFQF